MRSGSSGYNVHCYVCRNAGHVSLHAVVDSDNDAMRVFDMFRRLKLYVELVPNGDGAPDVKIGVCDNHVKNFENFEKAHAESKEISLVSIVRTLYE